MYSVDGIDEVTRTGLLIVVVVVVVEQQQQQQQDSWGVLTKKIY
jgi:hypothetical protein